MGIDPEDDQRFLFDRLEAECSARATAASQDEANVTIAHDMVLAWHHDRDNDFDTLANQVLTEFDIRAVLGSLASMTSLLLTALEDEGFEPAEELLAAVGCAVSLHRPTGDLD